MCPKKNANDRFCIKVSSNLYTLTDGEFSNFPWSEITPNPLVLRLYRIRDIFCLKPHRN